ncbi:MAG: polysaccharide pyruvyl transferase family protein [Chitinophagaceae bacterium]|nr:MAG: polysaccharide pyruvyl transferase family protein [Chitinophagaceae bacterium]
MTKIGILTFHKAHNYGAVLQAYALRKYLIQEGCDTNIVDYLSDVNRKSNLKCFFKRRNVISLSINFVFKFRRVLRRHKKFNYFIETYLSPKDTIKNSLNFRNLDYDIYCIGSDQVWNRKIIGRNETVYWGNINQSKKFKLTTYAASLGNEALNSEDINDVGVYLEKFDAISIREKEASVSVSNIINKQVAHVFDPTFLLDANSYEVIISKPIIKDDYILVYQIAVSNETIKLAESIANKLNSKVVYLDSDVNSLVPKKNTYDTVGPSEYLRLIKDAKCIITTSFHGTAFSIIYNRPFYLINIDSHNSRPKSLLQSLGLADRIIYNSDYVSYQNVDWEKVNDTLQKERQKSFEFLKRNLVG